MALRYGLPYFLDDKSGRLSGSEFVDMYNRMRIYYNCRVRNDEQTVYDIYDDADINPGQSGTPVISLHFGPNNSLGMIRLRGQQPRPMERYLAQINIFAGSKLRRFFASDGKEYRWGWRKVEGEEWTCTNSDAEVVADYTIKNPGSMLTISEDYGHLACEMLATLTIMRHIHMYDL